MRKSVKREEKNEKEKREIDGWIDRNNDRYLESRAERSCEKDTKGRKKKEEIGASLCTLLNLLFFPAHHARLLHRRRSSSSWSASSGTLKVSVHARIKCGAMTKMDASSFSTFPFPFFFSFFFNLLDYAPSLPTLSYSLPFSLSSLSPSPLFLPLSSPSPSLSPSLSPQSF